MKKQTTGRLAAIYIRVSSEKQAEKVSPQAQENDCREYAAANGYSVATVIRDTERYRVGRRLVEPSGTRSDRPGLKRLIAEADAGAFDVILAWREDRLYRGLRPMLELIECVERNRINIELVKETFDRKMAGIKASIAKLELDAIKERQTMGIAGRLAEGKSWASGSAYGYRKAGPTWEVVPDEAAWVQQIFQWYVEGAGIRDIRYRLIEAGAPQKTRKADAAGYAWEHCVLYSILRHDFYATGIKHMRWDGDVYDLPVEPIISLDLFQRARERMERQKRHPANNVKGDYLGLGLTYCAACSWKMAAVGNKRFYKGVATGQRYTNYICKLKQRGYAHTEGCARGVASGKADAQLWAKCWELISDDARFAALVAAHVDHLRSQEADADAEVQRLERALDELAMERQRVITWGRKGTITEDDMEMQLGALTIQDAGLRRELADKALVLGSRAEQVLDLANEVRAELRAGGEWLNTATTNAADAGKQVQLRRRIVELIVKRVDVLGDKTVRVEFELDLFDRASVQLENTPQHFRTEC